MLTDADVCRPLFPKEPDYNRFDDAAWEWLMRRIVLEWRAKVAFRFSNVAVQEAQATGDIGWTYASVC